MNFKEEYIKAAEEFTPDRQTIDRMKENVLNMTRAKKAFPFKTVAAVGGTVAACAVITLAAVHIAPKMTSDNMIAESTNMTSSPAAGGLSGAADRFDTDSAPKTAADDDGADICTTAMDTAAPEVSYDEVPSLELSIYDAADADEANAAPELADPGFLTPPREYTETTEYDPESFGSENYPLPEAGSEGTFDWVMPDEPNALPAAVSNDEPESVCEETCEGMNPTAGGLPFTGFTLTIAEDWSECTLSGDGETLTYKRSPLTNTTSLADDPSILYIPLTNTTDNKTYTVAYAYDIVIIRDENLEIVGLFI